MVRNLKYPLITLCAGASLTLAFAPFNIVVFAFLAPAILLGISINQYFIPPVENTDINTIKCRALKTWLCKPSIVAWYGWLFGVGFFGASASWVYISIHTYGGTNVFLSLLLTALFITVLALFTAVSIFLFCLLIDISNKISKKVSHITVWHLVFFFPLCWIIGDWLRSWVGSGFPWVYLGYSQLATPLRGFAPILGIYGTSFITALCAVLVYLICTDQSIWRTRIIALVSLGSIFGLGAGLATIKWTHSTNKTLTISLIQGNIAQEMKWDPNHFNNILNKYQQLTKSQLGRNLIIWPEGAIPAPTYYVDNYLAELDSATLAKHSTILLGIFLSNEQNNLYNGMIALGMSQGHYEKRHLVPFGEYVPFQHWLRGLIKFFDIPMSNLLAGPSTQALININGLLFSPSICYEIAYPTLIWRNADKANVLVNISDDSWFGRSIASAQQLQIAQMRALETGRPMIAVNNNGITGIISAEGRIVKQLPQNKTAVLQATVTGYTGATPIVWFMH